VVARRDEAKRNLGVAAHLLLALAGRTDPTIDEEAGALLAAEFGLRVISFLSPRE